MVQQHSPLVPPNRTRHAGRVPVSDGTKWAIGGLLVSVGMVILVFAALIMWAVVDAATGTTGTRTYHGPAAWLTVIAVIAVFAGILGGLIVAVVGGIVALATRSSRVAAAHQQLVLARDLATTPAEVAEVQAAVIPGRRWRKWLAVGRWVMPAGAAYLLGSMGLHTAAVVCVIAQLLLLVAVAVRLPVRGIGRPESDGHMYVQALPAREAGIREAASAAGWVYRPEAPRQPPGLQQEVTNLCTGIKAGVPFRYYDECRTVTLEVDGRATHETQVASRSVVVMSFPAVFQLAVVPASELGHLGVSAIGPRLHLESNEFEARYRAYCDDPVRGRMVLNPAVMALLLDAPLSVQVVVRNGVIQVLTPGTLLPPSAIEGFVATAVHLRQSAASAMTGPWEPRSGAPERQGVWMGLPGVMRG